MDPQQSWNDLLAAWVRRDWEAVLEYCEALIQWLDKDGFPPEFSYPLDLGKDFNRATVRAACEFVFQRASSVMRNPERIPQDVPFTLSCRGCLNEGPSSWSQSIRDGWMRIEYVPNAAIENFLGNCPNCRAKKR
jgi:hypothetical protein